MAKPCKASNNCATRCPRPATSSRCWCSATTLASTCPYARDNPGTASRWGKLHRPAALDGLDDALEHRHGDHHLLRGDGIRGATHGGIRKGFQLGANRIDRLVAFRLRLPASEPQHEVRFAQCFG